MGWMIMALGMVFMLVTGHVVESLRQQTQTRGQTASARLPAQQMLGLAAAINDWRHDHPLRDGMAPLSSLALVSPPDSRIHHRIVSDRLWVGGQTRRGWSVPCVSCRTVPRWLARSAAGVWCGCRARTPAWRCRRESGTGMWCTSTESGI